MYLRIYRIIVNDTARVFSHGMGKAPLFWGKIHADLHLRGKKNPEVNLILGENCMELKKFAEWKTPGTRPYYLKNLFPESID